MAWRVRARLPTGMVVIDNIAPDATFAAFKDALWAAAQLENVEDTNILAGFPPKPLDLSDDALISTVLSNNETVTVQFGAGGSNPEGKGKVKRRGGGGAATAKKASPPPKSGLHTLAGPANRPPPRHAGGSSSGGGASSSGGVGGSSSGGGGGRRKRTADALGSETDIASRLLDAVGGGSGTANQKFRGVFRAAVQAQWDQAKADARVRAALGGWFSIEDCAGQRSLATGRPTAMRVTFSKGTGLRSEHVEEVDCVEPPMIIAIVQLVLNGDDVGAKDMLKPHNMAAYSPRIFWSLVRHCGTGDIPAALRSLVPNADWSFLEVRERPLSAKAKANLEQQEERRRLKAERQRELALLGDGAAAATAAAWDDSDEAESDGEVATPAAAAAAAGAAAAATAAGAAAAATAAGAAAAATPAAAVVIDLNEVEEPAAAAAAAPSPSPGKAAAARAAGAAAAARAAEAAAKAAAAAAAAAETTTEDDAAELRELLGEESAVLVEAAGIRSTKHLAVAEAEKLAASARVPPERAAKWVSAAQGFLIDDIMDDILEGDGDVKEALDDSARISTPRDLALGGAEPESLVATLMAAMPEPSGDTEEDKAAAVAAAAAIRARITPAAVARWAAAAELRIQAAPWLDMWVTDV